MIAADDLIAALAPGAGNAAQRRVEVALAALGLTVLRADIVDDLAGADLRAVAVLAAQLGSGCILCPAMVAAGAAALNRGATMWWPPHRPRRGERLVQHHAFSLIVPARWGLDCLGHAILAELRAPMLRQAYRRRLAEAHRAVANLSEVWMGEIGRPLSSGRRPSRARLATRLRRGLRHLLVLMQMPQGAALIAGAFACPAFRPAEPLRALPRAGMVLRLSEFRNSPGALRNV